MGCKFQIIGFVCMDHWYLAAYMYVELAQFSFCHSSTYWKVAFGEEEWYSCSSWINYVIRVEENNKNDEVLIWNCLCQRVWDSHSPL